MLLAVSISYAQGLVSATLCFVCSGALICAPLAPSASCPAGFQVMPWLSRLSGFLPDLGPGTEAPVDGLCYLFPCSMATLAADWWPCAYKRGWRQADPRVVVKLRMHFDVHSGVEPIVPRSQPPAVDGQSPAPSVRLLTA